MEFIKEAIDAASRLIPLLATIAIVVALLSVADRVFRRRWQDNPDAQFKFQLIMLVLTFIGVLAVVVTLPINDVLRGQLLSLIGILLSAAIALSSTTFIGNIMAGIMLKTIKSARPGDFITVGELTGRITEMDLLHTEVQTEFRDLVTIPNLHIVTQPMKVVRASGTIITAEVSLGYDVPHSTVSDILCAAASSSGLSDAFVHVIELGDFAVSYRVAGLLEDVRSLITARSNLRLAVLDALHNSDIEIVSPNFMNTRALTPAQRFIPQAACGAGTKVISAAEAVAFDKADQAASVEEIRKEIEKIDQDLGAANEKKEPAENNLKSVLERRKAILVARLAEAEKRAEQLDDS